MTHPHFHAESSVKLWGGTVHDYMPIHDWLDATKEMYADFRHRVLRHHAQGIFEAERIFGKVRRTRRPRRSGSRIAELHVKEDCGGRIPSVSDWLSQIRLATCMLRGYPPDARLARLPAVLPLSPMSRPPFRGFLQPARRRKRKSAGLTSDGAGPRETRPPSHHPPTTARPDPAGRSHSRRDDMAKTHHNLHADDARRAVDAYTSESLKDLEGSIADLIADLGHLLHGRTDRLPCSRHGWHSPLGGRAHQSQCHASRPNRRSDDHRSGLGPANQAEGR